MRVYGKTVMRQVRVDDDPRSEVGSVACPHVLFINSVYRQHVYRCHILPIKCQTCSQTFDSSRMFTRHLLEQPDCDRSLCEAGEADEPITGLESLLQKVRAPKLTMEDPTEEDMWQAIYANLFPNDPKDYKPYPCE